MTGLIDALKIDGETNTGEPIMVNGLNPYLISFKRGPRCKCQTWVRFARDEQAARREAKAAVTGEYPTGVVLRVDAF